MRHLALSILLIAALPAAAQNVWVQAAASGYGGNQRNLVAALEKATDKLLDFRATPDTKTFREITGHIADTNFSVCAGMKGEENPQKDSLEKANLSKADLTAAVVKSGEYCNAVLKTMTDAQGAEMMKMFGQERPKAMGAVIIGWHTALHYGNLITYMRLNGIVPPETERAQRPRQ